MADLRSRKQGGSAVGTGGHTGSAADASRGIHGKVGVFFRYGQRIAVRCTAGCSGNVTAARNDAVEGAAVDDQIFHNGECFRSPWFQIQFVAIFKVTHVELANGCPALRAVGDSVDHESARSANTFAAIMIERNGFLTFSDEFLVE